MLMLMWNPLRRWWLSAFEAPAPAAVPAIVFRRAAPRLSGRAAVAATARGRPVTPFRAGPSVPARGVDGARSAARRFWMTLDPQDRRRAAIGGSFAEVCAALEKLAAVEEGRPG